MKKDPFEENDLSQKALKVIEKLKTRLMHLYNTKGHYKKYNALRGKSLVWEEKIVGAATIVADSRV